MKNRDRKLKEREHKELLRKIRNPVCPECGKPMVNAVDSITKKISKYLWKTTCGHFKGARISVG